MHAEEGQTGSPGRPRAKRDSIFRMAGLVVRDDPQQLVVRLRSGSTDFWRPAGGDWWDEGNPAC